MPAIKYKPSADCAYTQLISKIKGVPILPDITTNDSDKKSPERTLDKTSVPKNDVEIKKISNGLMLAQYYNSDSEDDEINNSESAHSTEENSCRNTQDNVSEQKVPTPTIQNEIPPGILCPPPELRLIVDKTASYVLKNGKDFEDILRAKNEKRFSFLSFKDPYYKYYTFKVTGTVCPDPIQVMTANSPHTLISNRSESHNNQIKTVFDKKIIGKATL